MTELFSFSFPQKNICSEKNMYVRLSDNNTALCENGIAFQAGGQADFNTYFNALALQKYKTYCAWDKLFVNLDFCGTFLMKIFGVSSDRTQVCIVEKRISSAKRTSISVEIPTDSFNCTMLYLSLNAESNGQFFSGNYAVQSAETLNRINIAVIICTYRREKYILRNLCSIHRFLETNPLFSKECIHFYVIDNGHTLSADAVKNDFVSLYQNKNCGGSAGFTRGLMEAAHSDRNHTHFLFMDDDVLLDCSVFSKLYILLSLLKKDCMHLTVGGSMIKLSDMVTQHEAGAFWDGKRIENLGRGLNLTEWNNVQVIETLPTPNYNAWWFCCYTMDCLERVGYPLPLFIKTDDIEYGLRTKAPILIMNGLSVWHEDFEGKYDGFVEYYVKRNELILSAVQDDKAYMGFQIVKLIKSVGKQIVFQRYFIADLIFKAYNDFLQGANFLLNTDGEKLNKSLMQACPPMKTAEELQQQEGVEFHEDEYKQSLLRIASKPIQVITLNGYLLPQCFYRTKKHECYTIDAAQCIPTNCFLRKRLLHWDITKNKGYVTQQKRSALFKYTFKLMGMSLKILFKYNKAVRSYRKHKKDLTSETFWKNYLNLTL